MISGESIRYSLRNLNHRKGRSFLTVLSIFVGIATIFIFISFGLGLYGYINDLMEGSSADKIIIQAKSMAAPGLDDSLVLGDTELRAVERSAGVYEATGGIFKAGKVEFNDESKYVFVSGLDPKNDLFMEVSDIEILEGRELRSSDSAKVVLGYNYMIADKIFSKAIGLNDKVLIQGKELRVVGFYEEVGNPQDDSNVYLTEDAMRDLYPNETLSYGMIVARVDADNVDKAIENVERKLRDVRDVKEGEEDFYVQSFAEMIDSYAGAMDIVIGFIILIALISVLVSAINTANTMITSVLERTKEIGVIKSIGGRNSEVFKIFLFESAFLGFVAGVIGVLLGWGLASLGGAILQNLGWGFLSPIFPYYVFVWLIVFAVVTGAVSGAIPAWRASKIDIVEALRYE